MAPRVRLPKENLEAIIPPRIKDDVASKPQRNAFSIVIDFVIVDKKLFFATFWIAGVIDAVKAIFVPLSS